MQTFMLHKPEVRSPHGLVAAQNRYAAEAGAAVLAVVAEATVTLLTFGAAAGAATAAPCKGRTTAAAVTMARAVLPRTRLLRPTAGKELGPRRGAVVSVLPRAE